MYKGACNALLHDLGGNRLPPHEGGGGGGGDVGLLEVGGLLEHLGGETEDAHLVPLCDNGSPEHQKGDFSFNSNTFVIILCTHISMGIYKFIMRLR